MQPPRNSRFDCMRHDGRGAIPSLVMLCCALENVHILRGVVGRPLLSPIHSRHADDAQQNSADRGGHTWTDDWTPGVVGDYHIMAYDRRGGGVVGYEVSSGRVFSQGEAAEQFMPPPMHLPSAYVVKFEHHIDSRLAECDVLSRSTAAEAIWQHTDKGPAAISQLFTVRAEAGWTDAIRSLRITSNSDDGFCCKCEVDRVAGPFRATMLRQVSAQGDCAVCPGLPGVAPGELPDFHHGISQWQQTTGSDAHTLFCTGVGRRLRGAGSFLVVSMAWWRDARGVCGTKVRNGLRYMQTIGGHARAQRLDDVPAPPRAAVLVDLKLSAQALDSADLALGYLCTLVESVVMMAKYIASRNGTGLSHLHMHEQLTLMQRQKQRSASAKRQAAQSPDKLQLQLAFTRTCDAVYTPIVHQFLESTGTAFTSERVNTTAVAVAVGQHVLECAQCLSAQLEALAGASVCMLAVAAGAEATLDYQTADVREGRLTLAADATAVGATLTALRVALEKKHQNAALDGGQTEDAMADDIVRCATDATHALLRRVSATSATLTATMQLWQATFRVAHNETSPGSSGNLSDPQQDLAEDVWCCSVLRHAPVVKDDLYPPCLPHQLRVVRRELDRRLAPLK